MHVDLKMKKSELKNSECPNIFYYGYFIIQNKNIQRKRAHERAKKYSKYAQFIGICEEQGR